jgi:hypothetical protein
VKSPSVITVANEEVSIVTVCQMLGVELPDDVGSGRSRKVHCPFEELYHSDGGVSPAMRIYPETNSAYCFSCSYYFTPVGLAARAMGVHPTTAAQRLLERIGHRPMDLAAAWKSVSTHQPQLDKPLLADALKTYCRRIDPAWSRRQFEPVVAAALTRCLSLLDLVVSADDVTLWLCRCKEVMWSVLDVETLSLSQKYAALWENMNDDGRTST